MPKINKKLYLFAVESYSYQKATTNRSGNL